MTGFNSADRKSVRRLEKSAKLMDRQEGEVITQLCATSAGRRWIWNRLSEASMFHTTFSTDPIQMAFSEGQRNQGLRLLDSVLLHCPEQFTLMMSEANERDTRSADPGERSGGEDAGGDVVESGGDTRVDYDFRDPDYRRGPDSPHD